MLNLILTDKEGFQSERLAQGLWLILLERVTTEEDTTESKSAKTIVCYVLEDVIMVVNTVMKSGKEAADLDNVTSLCVNAANGSFRVFVDWKPIRNWSAGNKGFHINVAEDSSMLVNTTRPRYVNTASMS
ncbi:hypothetical protein Tco_0111650 [Tanacetum coccineum]